MSDNKAPQSLSDQLLPGKLRQVNLWFGAAALMPILFALLSIATGEPTWLQRSGSLMILLGAVGEFQLAKTFDIGTAFKAFTRKSRSDPGFGAEKRAAQAGLILIVSGVLIWGFGDLPMAGLLNLLGS